MGGWKKIQIIIQYIYLKKKKKSKLSYAAAVHSATEWI